MNDRKIGAQSERRAPVDRDMPSFGPVCERRSSTLPSQIVGIKRAGLWHDSARAFPRKM